MSAATLLIFHGLVSVALLGAVTHQLVSLLGSRDASRPENAVGRSSFAARYVRVRPTGFSTAVCLLYIASVLLGAVIYPTYRLDVRVSFEEMSLFWAVGLFEIKEHWGGIGLGMLPLYMYSLRPQVSAANSFDRIAVVSLLALIVWGDFLTGHVLNNIRGL
ncbi:MAG: hypothetical protein AB7N70_34795 [Dehalococcoidia bacterium]